MALDVEGTYLRYGPLVLRRCRKLLRHDAKAQDAMQDVFVSLLRHEARLDDAALSALLLRMATNVCLNKLRGDKRHPEDRDDETQGRHTLRNDPRSHYDTISNRLTNAAPGSGPVAERYGAQPMAPGINGVKAGKGWRAMEASS